MSQKKSGQKKRGQKKSGLQRQNKDDPSVTDKKDANTHNQRARDVPTRVQDGFDNLPWQDIGPSFADFSSLSNLESGTAVPETAYESRFGLMTATWEHSGFYGLEVLPGS